MRSVGFSESSFQLCHIFAGKGCESMVCLVEMGRIKDKKDALGSPLTVR